MIVVPGKGASEGIGDWSGSWYSDVLEDREEDAGELLALDAGSEEEARVGRGDTDEDG